MGRRPKLTDEDQRRLRELYHHGRTSKGKPFKITDLCRLFGASYPTVRKAIDAVPKEDVPAPVSQERDPVRPNGGPFDGEPGFRSRLEELRTGRA